MLKKENRIIRNKDFDNIFKGGEKIYGKSFNLIIKKNEFNFVRIGIIISNKISKKAVVRNKIKRRIRNIFIKNLANIKENVDIIVVTFPGVELTPFFDLKINLENAIRQIK